VRDLPVPYPVGRSVVPRRPVAVAYAQPPLPLSWNDSAGDGRTRPPVARVVRWAEQAGTQARPAGLPEPGAWVVTLMHSVREVLAGERPLGQLRRWVGGEVYEWLGHVSATRPAPLGTVRSVHLCEPRRGVVEATVIVEARAGARAVAVRLDAVRGSWRCSNLDVL
jgi:hypothetical protein